METTHPGSDREQPGAGRRDSRTITELFAELWRETTGLLHQEAELARAEVGEKVSQVQAGVGAIAIGAAVLFAGFLVTLLAAVGAIALFMPPVIAAWLAPLIVGVAVMIVGAIALAHGRADLAARNLAPTRTAGSLRRDASVFKEHIS